MLNLKIWKEAKNNELLISKKRPDFRPFFLCPNRSNKKIHSRFIFPNNQQQINISLVTMYVIEILKWIGEQEKYNYFCVLIYN